MTYPLVCPWLGSPSIAQRIALRSIWRAFSTIISLALPCPLAVSSRATQALRGCQQVHPPGTENADTNANFGGEETTLTANHPKLSGVVLLFSSCIRNTVAIKVQEGLSELFELSKI